MIQRIQTLYLFLAGILVMLTYIVPIVIFTDGTTTYNLYACHILHPETHEQLISVIPMAVLPVLSLFFSFFAIFKFKNRSFQYKLGQLNMIILIAFIIVECVYYTRISKILVDADATPYIGIFIPTIALILVFLANKAIKKDERLVKSADRIR